MRLNILTLSICLVSTGDGVFARPTTGALMHRGVNLAASEAAAAPQPLDCATPPAGQEEQAGEEEEGAKNEVEIESAFDTAVAVQGGDLKQDLVFTPSTVGKFEYEFQSLAADSVTVTENTSPAAAPAGFEAIEPNSYIVDLATSKGAGLTLSKIDYIFDPASAGLAGKDITKAQVGRLCTETNAFVISKSLGELEFELEENEVTLNLNKNVTAQGEWGIFLPVAAPAAAAPPAVQEGAGAGAGAGPEAGAGAEVGAGAGKNEGAGRGRGAAGRNRQDDDDSDDEDDD